MANKPLGLNYLESLKAVKAVYDTYAAFNGATKEEGFYKIKEDENQGSIATQYYYDGASANLVGQELAKGLAPNWEATTDYKTNQLLVANDRLYRVVGDYTSAADVNTDISAEDIKLVGATVVSSTVVLKGTLSTSGDYPTDPSTGDLYIIGADINLISEKEEGTATVAVDGVTVTRVSGDAFEGSLVGKELTINGQTAVVESVTDGDELVLDASVGEVAIAEAYVIVIASTDYKAGDEILYVGTVWEKLGNVSEVSWASITGKPDVFVKGVDDASNIDIVDTEDNFTATNVEGALAELKDDIAGLNTVNTVGYEADRVENILADTNYTLPNGVTYKVGSNKLKVYVEGNRFFPVAHFTEVGDAESDSTQIQFKSEIDKTYKIFVEVDTVG